MDALRELERWEREMVRRLGLDWPPDPEALARRLREPLPPDVPHCGTFWANLLRHLQDRRRGL